MKNWINKFFKKKEELKKQKEHSLLDIDISQWSDDNKILFAQTIKMCEQEHKEKAIAYVHKYECFDLFDTMDYNSLLVTFISLVIFEKNFQLKYGSTTPASHCYARLLNCTDPLVDIEFVYDIGDWAANFSDNSYIPMGNYHGYGPREYFGFVNKHTSRVKEEKEAKEQRKIKQQEINIKKEEQKKHDREEFKCSLERFIAAQEKVYQWALTEVKSGKKLSHWIWYIFPQLKGLGTSESSQYYGINDIEEARAYLNHPILGARLREITSAFLDSVGKNAQDVFGYLDAMKVRSCMTLFNEVSDDDVFRKVLDRYYSGLADEKTLAVIGKLDVKILCGAIAGDIIGSRYEFFPHKDTSFPLFHNEYSDYTDDTVMTIANADWLISNDSLLGVMQDYGKRYPTAGYGGMFKVWLREDEPKPYNSFGNGSAMRVSPVGWAFDTLEKTLESAKESAKITHNHPEGIKGAQATAACIFMARTGKSKQEIKEYIESTFGYNLSRTCDEIRPTYKFDGSCQGTVPESIIAFLESTDFENAIRLAVSLGGDADTMGAITGGIAEAFYGGVPEHIRKEVLKRLPNEFIEVMQKFYQKFVEK